MQHQDQVAGSNSDGLYSVKSYEKVVSDSLRAEHIQDVHVRCIEKWPGTESLSTECRSLPHLVSDRAEGDKIKMLSSMLRKQWPEDNFFSQVKISPILRRFSISKLTEFMPQHLEKLVTRIQKDRHPASVMVWWGVSYDATTKLHFCEKGVKTSAKVYENTVQELLWSLWTTLSSVINIGALSRIWHLPTCPKVWLRGIFWISLLCMIPGHCPFSSSDLNPMDSKSGQCLKALSITRGTQISKAWSAPWWKQW